MREEDLTRLAAAMRSRATQIRMRLGLAAVIAPIFLGFTGWTFALGWFVTYAVLQAAERAMFPVGRIDEMVARRGGPTRAIGIVFLNNVVFGMFGAVGMIGGGPWAAALGALLVSGSVLNSVLVASGSRHLFFAGLTPQVGYFMVLVGVVMQGGSPALAAMTAFGCALNIMAAVLTWRLFSLVLDAQRQARAEAEAANKAKSDFLANMSHEVRTPLNGVLGIASVLARTPLTEQQLDYVKTVETSALTLQTLLTDILDLSKIEAGAVDLESHAFDLEQVVCDVGKLFDQPAREKGLKFRVEVARSARVWVTGDRTRLAQILTNLCSNAVKFTQSGSITVRAQVEGRLILEVEDTGIGLSEEACAKVFERFSQADSSISRLYGGTGLGLAISQSLAHLMDGRLSVRSTLGEGSVFRFEALMPVVERPAAEETRLEPAEGEAAHECERAPRVLLAEDHPVNRQVVEAILAGIAEVESVSDGQGAVEAAARSHYDLILMDMQMPVMDGLAATRAIREAEKAAGRPRTPVIMLTANVLREHEVAAAAAGADLHLAKPITAESLLTAMGQVLTAGERKEAAA